MKKETTTRKYNFWTAIGKSLKNNAVTLLPFVTVLGLVAKDLHFNGYFWGGTLLSVLAYFLKNLYDRKKK